MKKYFLAFSKSTSVKASVPMRLQRSSLGSKYNFDFLKSPFYLDHKYVKVLFYF